MKTATMGAFLGVMIAGFLHGPAPVHAQSASEPLLADDEDKPWGQGVSIESRVAARVLFLEGNRRFRIPLFAKAAEKYTAALERWKHPAVYFNLALAQLNLGQDVEARESLKHALQYGAEPLGTEQFHEARKQLEELEHQLGRIRVTCRTAGAVVILDGVTLFIGPGTHEGWAKATEHEIVAKKAGYRSEIKRVKVASRELRAVELKLLKWKDAVDASRRWSVWKPWLVVAAGGAIAAAGGVLHTRAAKDFNVYDEQFRQLDCGTDPGEYPGCTSAEVPSSLDNRLIRAERQQTIAVGGYIAGGSLIAAGVVLLYLNRPRLAEQGGTSAPARHPSIVPTVSDGMLGVLVQVSH